MGVQHLKSQNIGQSSTGPAPTPPKPFTTGTPTKRASNIEGVTGNGHNHSISPDKMTTGGRNGAKVSW